MTAKEKEGKDGAHSALFFFPRRRLVAVKPFDLAASVEVWVFSLSCTGASTAIFCWLHGAMAFDFSAEVVAFSWLGGGGMIGRLYSVEIVTFVPRILVSIVRSLGLSGETRKVYGTFSFFFLLLSRAWWD